MRVKARKFDRLNQRFSKHRPGTALSLGLKAGRATEGERNSANADSASQRELAASDDVNPCKEGHPRAFRPENGFRCLYLGNQPGPVQCVGMEAHAHKETKRVGRVRQLRESRGLTQFELALASDTSINTVARADAGLGPKKDTPGLQRIAAALGVTVEELRG